MRAAAVALALGLALTASPARAQDEDPRDEGNFEELAKRARIVGVGENLGRDKKSTVLNYTLYGGRTYAANGKPALVLHKLERPAAKGSLFGDDPPRNSVIISYQYVAPDVIYLQGVWMKVLEFDNVKLQFVVLEDRRPIAP